MLIWKQYLIGQFLKVFFLFICCFYGLYVIIDFANHSSFSSTLHGHVPLRDITLYYLYVFSSRAEILIPIALLIAFVKTVTTLNAQNELTALMASGIRIKALMQPFIVVSLICTGLIYTNEQFLLPHAQKKLHRIEALTKHQRHRNYLSVAVHHLALENRSTLLYQNYESDHERFFDVYWIPSVDSIYRMKYLYHNRPIPQGVLVDHFKRTSSGELLQNASYLEYPFPEIELNKELLYSAIFDPDALSLTSLIEEIKNFSPTQNEKESKVMTTLLWKLAIPWLCLIVVIGAAPSCVRFSRQIPLFFIYAFSLFSLIAFYMFIDAALVVSKRQVISPFVAIICPFLFAFSFLQYRFAKL